MDVIPQEEIELICACLTRIGFNKTVACSRNASIVAEGFSSINDLADIAVKDVSAMCKKILSLPNGRRGILIGYNLHRRLKGFVFWVKDHQRQHQIPNEADFSLDVCKEALENMDIEEKCDSEDAKIEAPGKLKSAEWLQWELKLINFLHNISGASGVPLRYVIHKDIPVGYEFANDQEELINTCPLVGAVFDEDNRKVFAIIKQSIAETPNWDWIYTLNQAQDGRAAMQMLHAHFDGPGEVEKRMQMQISRLRLEALHYISESRFPFSMYATGLNAGFKTLEEAGESLTERNKVSIMLKGIRDNNTFLISVIQTIQRKPETKNDFATASNELGEQIAIIFPSEIRKTQIRGGRHTSAMSGQGYRGGRGGSGQGHGHGPYQGHGGYRGPWNSGGYHGGYHGGGRNTYNRGSG